MMNYDVMIVGGGSVGCAIAYALSRYDLKVAVAEKELDVGMGTSGRNSGVVHAGFNNRPGSLMAKLCVEGNEGFEALCKMLDIPYKRTGKLIVGYDEADHQALIKLKEQGEKNGVKGLEIIDGAAIRAIEPDLPASWAMLSRNTAVFNPFLYSIHLAEASAQNGVQYYLNSPVTAVEATEEGYRVQAGDHVLTCRTLINSAGLFADKVSAMAGDPSFTIYPCRGEYYLLDKGTLKMPVYPVPRPGVGGLGVHLTVTVDGNILIGPSADYIDNHEDYSTTEPILDQLRREAMILLPTLNMRTVIGTYAGVRPKLVKKGEANFGDFVIERSPKAKHLINLIGIESPGITASMPIARMVLDILSEDTELVEKPDFIPTYRGIPPFGELSRAEQRALIEQDPDYGDVVCRCETVTRAQVKRALHNPIGATGVIAVKNRTRSTMGRCNGGYCFQRIVELLLSEGKSPQDIDLKRRGDRPLLGYVKGGQA